MKSIPKPWQVTLAAVIPVLLIGGWWGANWRGRVTDTAMRERLLAQAEAVAQVINPDRVKALSFIEADKTNPGFRRTCSQMKAYAQAVGLRSLYSMALRDGNIVFGPESLAEDDPWASPPGTIYQKIPAELPKVFDTGLSSATGLYKDEYGVFLSAFAPVSDPDTGEVLLVIGMDIEAGEWRRAIARARLIPILFAAALGLLLIGGAILLYWRERYSVGRRERLHHTETCLTAAVGLALTVLVTIAVHDNESRSRQRDFSHLADAKATSIRGAFQDIRDSLIQTAMFFQASEGITRQEFHIYAGSLARSQNLEALLWIPVVPPSYRVFWETEMRNDGFPEFMVYEKGANGEPLPVPVRDMYYPGLYVEPLEGNEHILGYDFGSHPIYRAGLEEALKNRSPSVTEAPSLLSARTGRTNILVFYPIYSGYSETSGVPGSTSVDRQLRGLVLAVLSPENMLLHTLNPFKREDTPTIACLHELTWGQPPQFLAASPRKHGEAHENTNELVDPQYSDFSRIYPLFVVNKTYALVVHPGSVFLEANPVRAGRTAALIGLFLTMVLTAFVGFLSNRHVDLERQVQARTAELQEAQQRFERLFQNNPAMMALASPPDRNFFAVNEAFLTTLGYGHDEVIGRSFTELGLFADQEQQDAIGSIIEAEGRITGHELQVRCKNGAVRDGLFSGEMVRTQGRDYFLTVMVDITERKKAEEAVRRRLDYEQAAADCMGFLLESYCLDDQLPLIAGILREAVEADRVYIFQNEDDPETGLCMTQTHEAVAEEITPQIDNALLQRLPYREGAPSLLPALQARQPYAHVVAEMEGSERRILESQGILSILILPIHAGTEFWGFIGFDDCATVRRWQEEDISLLHVVADSIGATILRDRAEEALRNSEQRLSDLVDFLPDATMAIDSDGKVITWNRAMEEMTGIKANDIIGKGDYEYALPFYGIRRPILIDLPLVSDEETEKKYHYIKREGDTRYSESDVVLQGELRILWGIAKPLYDSSGNIVGAIESIRDITDRKQAEIEREKLQAQLLQAQKMESVGRLAGGVAHDFNNMLQAILGSAYIALEEIPPDGPIRDSLLAIQKAAERSANLTRQLLAFARKQMISPQVLNLNGVVEGMLKMLPRLIGEDIELSWKPGTGIGTVRIDPSQVDQILANLTVN
ncbi:MAG: PAS domain S-box protein, partial [bacterium]